MTNKKQVIINGCNVSKCVHLDRYFLPNNNKEFKDCALSNLYYREFEHSCKDNPSCYFKQLTRKTQECEELEKKIRIKDDENSNLNKKYRQEQAEKFNYRKALEEIEEIAKSFNKNELCFYKEINECDCCDMGADCNYLRRAKILYIINKVKDNNNEQL